MTSTPDWGCVGCGTQLPPNTLLTDGYPTPQDGDAAICLYCRTWLIFTPTGYRHPTDTEFHAISRNPATWVAVAAINDMHHAGFGRPS